MNRPVLWAGVLLSAVGLWGLRPSTSAAAFCSMMPPPVNLRVVGVWRGGPTDHVKWDPVVGAVRYHLYQYDTRIATVTRPGYIVSVSQWEEGMLYAVTAEDAAGVESVPSNLVEAQGAPNPAEEPRWIPPTPTTPQGLTATPEWNNGSPRISLTWHSTQYCYTYTVYRDGIRYATGIWGLTYIDQKVLPGESHRYSVAGANLPRTTTVEGAPTPWVKARAPLGPPATVPGGVQITRIDPNDDSAMVFWAAVPGAVDYRIYDITRPCSKKYSGGGLSAEWNGMNPVSGADLVVEAVDKLGPFQKMDGWLGPGAAHPDGATRMAINGLGDPSNSPNVLSRSTTFHVSCQSRLLTGTQVFFDTFRGSQPFTPFTPHQALMAANFNEVSGVENDRWKVFLVRADLVNTKVFISGNHFMETFYDGGTPGGSVPLHTGYASVVMMPKATPDISDGRVLHVTYEVDPHFNIRRWTEVQIAAPNDPIRFPGNFVAEDELPTVSGDLFRWQQLGALHTVSLFRSASGALQETMLVNVNQGANTDRDAARRNNGTRHDIDRRKRFDLYLSQNRFRIDEDGRIFFDRPFPTGTSLPFSQLAVYFVHQVYHTANDRSELTRFSPAEAYWYNYRPYMDERHWDNMGFEVLTAFP